ncbi:hypothetical protein SAMN05660841_02036 [Sphingobacterium nematocida]|uniref:Uncharacterized protein n=1 Tax=Sphingobacterium nematocida TaxID=1513896 RepID=A0A1T5DKB2_9SPHI|nr:hypothetical protein [Sphingobacterium nematocida]SKB72124.1 hypothetical protein SAMN05660841_02036 [Sphingobacterium nematocida]
MKTIIALLSAFMFFLSVNRVNAQSYIRGPYTFEHMQPDANQFTIDDPYSNRKILIRVEVGYDYSHNFNYINYGKVYGVVSAFYDDNYQTYPYSLSFNVELLDLSISLSNGLYSPINDGPIAIEWDGTVQVFGEYYTSYPDHLSVYSSFMWSGNSNVIF